MYIPINKGCALVHSVEPSADRSTRVHVYRAPASGSTHVVTEISPVESTECSFVSSSIVCSQSCMVWCEQYATPPVRHSMPDVLWGCGMGGGGVWGRRQTIVLRLIHAVGSRVSNGALKWHTHTRRETCTQYISHTAILIYHLFSFTCDCVRLSQRVVGLWYTVFFGSDFGIPKTGICVPAVQRFKRKKTVFL